MLMDEEFFFCRRRESVEEAPFCQQSFHEGEIPMHPSACQLSSSVSFVYNTDRTHANGQTPPYKTSSQRGKIHWLIVFSTPIAIQLKFKGARNLKKKSKPS